MCHGRGSREQELVIQALNIFFGFIERDGSSPYSQEPGIYFF